MQDILSSLSTIGIFILVIGVLVFIHELGHFLLAKYIDAHVEEFALGLGPKIWSKKIGEVVYKINLLPIGGYVKVKGEVYDGNDDKDPRSLRNKKPFLRILVMIAGVLMNFILASILYFIVFLNTDFKFFIPEKYADFKPYLAEITKEKYSDKVEYMGLTDGKGAKESGMPEKGYIKSINGIEIVYTNEIPQLLQENKNQIVKIEACDVECNVYDVKTDELGKIGISIVSNYIYVMNYSGNKITSGFVHGINMLRIMFDSLSDVFGQAKQTGDYTMAVNSISGPVGMYLAIDTIKGYGLISILGLTADLSLVLAFMNLLPIPALDGGRILLTLPELFTGKKLNSKLETILINVSFLLLLLLMFVVFVKDIVFFDEIKEMLGKI